MDFKGQAVALHSNHRIIVFLSGTLLSPIIEMSLWKGELLTPQPLQIGSHVLRPPRLDAIVELAEVVMEIYMKPDLQWGLVDYTYVGLNTIVATGTRDITDDIIKIARGPEIDGELELLKKIGKEQARK